jgi:hypothetical protein
MKNGKCKIHNQFDTSFYCTVWFNNFAHFFIINFLEKKSLFRFFLFTIKEFIQKKDILKVFILIVY